MKKTLLISLIIFIFLYFLFSSKRGIETSLNGKNMNQFADEIIKKYDVNADNVLSVANESFLSQKVSDTVFKIESRGLLFSDSDTFGNNNGLVTKIELVDYLSKFDTDGDGEITNFKNIFQSIFKGKSEGAIFDEKYGEKYKYENIND